MVIQTCPQRRGKREPTLKSIRESDIGNNFVLMEHPEGQHIKAFFKDVLLFMSRAPTPYVIRFEDDVLVNKHILHNALTWGALKHPDFGAGWLMVPEKVLDDAYVSRAGFKYRRRGMWAALAVIFPTKHVASCLEDYDAIRIMRQDITLSAGIRRLNKLIFLHQPSLAENRDWDSSLGSTRGTTGVAARPQMFRAGRHFDPNFKR